jgi:ABC-type hemin transport system ATPase subunit
MPRVLKKLTKRKVAEKAILLEAPVSSFDAHATRISTRSMFAAKEEGRGAGGGEGEERSREKTLRER